MSDPTVTITVVNYNCARHLEKCLESVDAQTFRDHKLIIVDNASSDGSQIWLEDRRNEGWFRLIRNADNTGYCRAMNQAIAASDSPYFFALNPDVTPQPEYLEILVSALEENPRAGYAIGKLLFTGRDNLDRPVVFSAGQLVARGRWAYNRGIDRPDAPRFDGRGFIPGANGGAVVYRREFLRDVAIDGEILDEDFFMYYDDIDMDWRAALRGWGCWYEGRAIAYNVSKATGFLDTPAGKYHFLRNRYLTILKNDTLGALLRDAGAVAATELREAWPYYLKNPRLIPQVARGVWQLAPKILRKRRLQRDCIRRGAQRAQTWREAAKNILRLDQAALYSFSTEPQRTLRKKIKG
ncbi:MAG: glycosyltransferase family 2 protein [bacterium]